MMMTTDRSRPPGATLEEHFAYFTECALATAEEMENLKGSAKYRVERARSIAAGMVDTCVRFQIDPLTARDGLIRRNCPRLRDAMLERANQPALTEGPHG